MDKEHVMDTVVKIWMEKGEIKSLRAKGKSMYPLIKDGDEVNIKLCSPDKLSIGDIIVFRRQDVNIVHRLIKKVEAGYLEKGDMQISASYIKKIDVIGKVLCVKNKNLRFFVSGLFINGFIAKVGCIINKIKAMNTVAKILLLIPFIINVCILKYYSLSEGFKRKK